MNTKHRDWTIPATAANGVTDTCILVRDGGNLIRMGVPGGSTAAEHAKIMGEFLTVEGMIRTVNGVGYQH